MGFLVVLGCRESGLVIATANGAWAGVLLIVLSVFAFLTMKLWDAFSHNLLDDFEAFLRVLGTEASPFTEVGVNPKLIAFSVGAAAVVRLVSELLHWCRLRIRRHRGLPEEKKQVRAGVARAGAHM